MRVALLVVIAVSVDAGLGDSQYDYQSYISEKDTSIEFQTDAITNGGSYNHKTKVWKSPLTTRILNSGVQHAIINPMPLNVVQYEYVNPVPSVGVVQFVNEVNTNDASYAYDYTTNVHNFPSRRNTFKSRMLKETQNPVLQSNAEYDLQREVPNVGVQFQVQNEVTPDPSTCPWLPTNMAAIWRFKNDIVHDHAYAVSNDHMNQLVGMQYIKEMVMGYVIPSTETQYLNNCPKLEQLSSMYNRGKQASALGYGEGHVRTLSEQGYVVQEVLGYAIPPNTAKDTSCCASAGFQRYITNTKRFFYTALPSQKKIVDDDHWWTPDGIVCTIWDTTRP